MDDRAFLEAFESCSLENAAFHHRDHVRVAWLYLRRDGPDRGAQRVLEGIRRFATAHGAADRFHETLTRFWIGVVQHVIEAFPNIDRFEDFLSAFPPLVDKSAIYRHYSHETLWSPTARSDWTPPDLLPLP